jgi:hypothetical protein
VGTFANFILASLISIPFLAQFGLQFCNTIMRIMIKKPEDVLGKAWPAIVVGLFVAFGGVLFG